MTTLRGRGSGIHGTAGCDEVGGQGKERGGGGDWGWVNADRTYRKRAPQAVGSSMFGLSYE